MTYPDEMDPLDQPTPAEQRLIERKGKPKGWERRYPKPEQADIEDVYARLRPAFDLYFTQVNDNRAVRYLQDQTPKKWARRLQGYDRFRSRLSHNETLRIAAMMTRNSPKIKIPQSGKQARDEKRGDKQSRWSNNLFQAFERRSSRPLLRAFCDNVAGDGTGVFEFYLTENSVYDSLDTDPREILPDDGGPRRLETPEEIIERTDGELEGAPLPFGLRVVDPLSCLFDEDEDGICAALIVEQKPYRGVFNKIKAKHGNDPAKDPSLPKPGTYGWPVMTSGRGSSFEDGSANWYSPELGGGEQTNAQSSVLTMRYYDRRWYMYIVGGVCVEGPVEHHLPGVPVFPCLGMVTGSSNLHENRQGITWGMTPQEVYLNTIVTNMLDVLMTTSRPKPIILTAAGNDNRAKRDGKPITYDFSSDQTPQLAPGQTIADLFEHLRPQVGNDAVQLILQMWQRSGLNPIAQGESPGSDAAGYTVNTLSQAAQSQYEILLDNYARCLGNVVDFARLVVRDTIKEKVYLSVPMQDAKRGGTEWLALGPDDVDETPSIVTIDPLSDANRMALRQSLMQGNKEGFVPREPVQREGFGADDPEAWDDDLIVDAAEQDLAASAREAAKAIVAGAGAQFFAQMQAQLMAPGQTPPGEGQDPNAPPTAGAPVPAGPAPTQSPTVGAAAHSASTAFSTAPGPAAMPASSAMAGQPRGGGTGRAA